MAGEVRQTRDGTTATLTLAHLARRNAITAGMWQAVGEQVRALGEDDSVRVIVLRGEGADAFSAGADISEFDEWRSSSERGLRYQRLVAAATDAVAEVPKPVIAMIYGFCVGGGCELAIACDVRFAAEGSRFGIPASKLNIHIDPKEVARLTALIGPGRARELLYSGDLYDCAWAERVGLINRIFPAGALERETYAWAARVGENAPGSIRWSKRNVEHFMHTPGAEVPDHEAVIGAHFESEDYREGRRAFLEKRKPRFTGR